MYILKNIKYKKIYIFLYIYIYFFKLQKCVKRHFTERIYKDELFLNFPVVSFSTDGV